MKKIILAIIMAVCLISSIAAGFMGSWDSIIPNGEVDDWDSDTTDDWDSDTTDDWDSDTTDDWDSDTTDDWDSDTTDWIDDNYNFNGDDDFIPIDDEGPGPGPFDGPVGDEDDPDIPDEFPPVANIGIVHSAEINENIIFDGSRSYDPDGEIVSYEWDFGDGNSGNSATEEHAYTDEGVYTISLTVTDDDGKTDTDRVNIEVIDEDDDDENNDPVITSRPVTEADVGVRYNYDVDAEDVDNDTLTYSLTESPEEMTVDSATGLIEWRPEEEGEYDVTVTVEDGNGGSDSQVYTINVEDDEDDDGEEIIIDNKLAVRAKISSKEYMPAGEIVRIRTNVENIGANDLENIKIIASVQELAIRDMSGSFDLNDGDETSKNLQLRIPEYAEQGTYTVKLSFSNDDMRRVIYREITVI
ncbi:PKD domain-containing protein [Candidatus Woesearchaeota archaeon]|nr:PKD domain-containing protein [Candidatus Woesearchaeota archaeon]